jgi:hypothetical protein
VWAGGGSGGLAARGVQGGMYRPTNSPGGRTGWTGGATTMTSRGTTRVTSVVLPPPRPRRRSVRRAARRRGPRRRPPAGRAPRERAPTSAAFTNGSASRPVKGSRGCPPPRRPLIIDRAVYRTPPSLSLARPRGPVPPPGHCETSSRGRERETLATSLPGGTGVGCRLSSPPGFLPWESRSGACSDRVVAGTTATPVISPVGGRQLPTTGR